MLKGKRITTKYSVRFRFRNSKGKKFGNNIVSLRFNFCVNGTLTGFSHGVFVIWFRGVGKGGLERGWGGVGEGLGKGWGGGWGGVGVGLDFKTSKTPFEKPTLTSPRALARPSWQHHA